MGQLSMSFVNTYYDAMAQIQSTPASQRPLQQQTIQGMIPLPGASHRRGLGVTNGQSTAMSVEQAHPQAAENDHRQRAPQHLPVSAAMSVPETSWAQIASASSSSDKPLPRSSPALTRIQPPEQPLPHPSPALSRIQPPEQPLPRSSPALSRIQPPEPPLPRSSPALTKTQPSERAESRANQSVKQHAAPCHNGGQITMQTAEMLPTGAASQQNDSETHGILEDGKAGIVVIKGPFRSIQNVLSFISTKIHEGPIYDMSMNKDQEVVVVFQYALHAQIFVDRNTECLATRQESVFGPGNWTVALGNPMEWTETLRRMAHPHRERRRLTFVKSRLFADHTSFQKWVREVQDVAGHANVDFVWAFNTGNATAVFFSVATARKVMQTFLNWKLNRGCYHELAVSYSSDPCEKDLLLTTQLRYHMIPPHRAFNRVGPNGAAGDRPSNGRPYYQSRK
ncbi:conserved hypothetical protein [Talaromyces stipitatus ATCC 10500]|uniref:Uncharacterized protein n=1 Tax=Talaromyces stipitatus (strain ATCC 10500 / CBS 375.48 / QM 6759 / NRRL 1006) TaxID=441959 RepID=B8MEE8_TALSN|nr:uncharacterized protein TSTA_016520 [Talaromyces stipitatus ATCC 10500]EED16575.1 conserved hypothetical protein [Talaromyces stipitatus ATCC 10500]